MERKIPVFLFNGFLDSGKTTLIKEIIEGEKAYQNKDTLIISFEDGEVDYDRQWIEKYGVSFLLIDDDLLEVEDLFFKIVQKYNPKQIVMELNAFINFDDLRLPRSFEIHQEVTLFDATKFELYYNNMKPLINQLVQYSTLVVFNRCYDSTKLSKFRRNIRVFNQRVDVAFETADKKLTTLLDEDLPYDINCDEIILEDNNFPIFYLDVTECFDKYQDKIIKFNAYVRDTNENTIILGRQIMTCCEDDIQFYGFECLTDQTIYNNSFVEVTAKVVKEFSHIANANVIMLKAISIKILEYIEEEYLVFS